MTGSLLPLSATISVSANRRRGSEFSIRKELSMAYNAA